MGGLYCISNDPVLRDAGPRQVTCIVRERQLRIFEHVARLPAEDPAHRILFCPDPSGCTMPRGLLQVSGASGGVLSGGFEHGGPGVYLDDGQTEAEGVPSQVGRGDALLRRMPP